MFIQNTEILYIKKEIYKFTKIMKFCQCFSKSDKFKININLY